MLLSSAITSGAGARVFERMIEAQGGDPRVVEDPSILPRAPETALVGAETDGFVAEIDPLEIALSAVAIGAGRTRVDQAVDHAVGVEILAPRGAGVRRGDPLARLYLRRPSDIAVAARVASAFRVTSSPPPLTALVRGRVA